MASPLIEFLGGFKDCLILKITWTILYKLINGFSPEWVLKWPLKLPNPENDLEHSSQVYGFSPECVLRWVLRLSDSENYLEHSLQVNGFSPELNHNDQWERNNSTCKDCPEVFPTKIILTNHIVRFHEIL